jgi:hypothetical protein
LLIDALMVHHASAIAFGLLLLGASGKAQAGKTLVKGQALFSTLAGRHERAAGLYHEAGDERAAAASLRRQAVKLMRKDKQGEGYTRAAKILRSLGDKKGAVEAMSSRESALATKYDAANDPLRAAVAEHHAEVLSARAAGRGVGFLPLKAVRSKYSDAGHALEGEGNDLVGRSKMLGVSPGEQQRLRALAEKKYRQAGRAFSAAARLDKELGFPSDAHADVARAYTSLYALTGRPGDATKVRIAKEAMDEQTAREWRAVAEDQRRAAEQPKPVDSPRTVTVREAPAGGYTAKRFAKDFVDTTFNLWAGWKAVETLERLVGN